MEKTNQIIIENFPFVFTRSRSYIIFFLKQSLFLNLALNFLELSTRSVVFCKKKKGNFPFFFL